MDDETRGRIAAIESAVVLLVVEDARRSRDFALVAQLEASAASHEATARRLKDAPPGFPVGFRSFVKDLRDNLLEVFGDEFS